MGKLSRIAVLPPLVLLLAISIGPEASAQTPPSENASVGGTASQPRAVDSFDSLTQWSTNPSEGVEISVHQDSGRHGRAMRVDFDFHGHAGYGIVHRNVNLDMPANYEFSFSVRGEAPANTLEFKLVDTTGANVWWSNNPDFDFPHEWRTITRAKRQICFAWGPRPQDPRRGGGDIRRVGAIEFAITAGSGGRGSVWIDDLTIKPIEPDSPFDVIAPIAPNPIVGTWESAVKSSSGTGGKLDFAADGSFRTTIGAMVDFGYTLSHNQLTTTFSDSSAGKSWDFTTTIHVGPDTLAQKGDNLFGRDVVMKRIGSAKEGDDSIIGVWSYPDYTGAVAFVAFEKNGRGEFRLPWSSCAGKWTDSGKGQLIVTLNRVTVGGDYSIENGVLVLKYDQGRKARYIRRVP